MCTFEFVWYVNYYDEGNHNVVADVIFHNFTVSTNADQLKQTRKTNIAFKDGTSQWKDDANINKYISQ